ncbi:MAG: MFS transporter [Rhodoplanes sp.]|uniref:MFS transporter n=1 Tax=Rhodoplanes sp. TaxID=1968906 RepID=UPI00185833C9|nr:MFS transporter [Rhodoplanes sp.]NVO15320.1 MFS transporter [Rhodoplanes sp.]
MTIQPLDHVPASPVVAVGAAPVESKFAEIFASFRAAFKVDGLLLMGLFAAWLFDAMDATIYAYAVPSIIKDLNVTMAEAFSVVSVFLASTAIGGIVIASIGDKIGRKPTVLLSVVLYGVFNFLCGTAESLTELSIYRGLVGFGLGGLWPAAMALVSEVWPAKSRGMAVGVLQTGWTFGLLTAAMFAFTIIPSHGWRWMFYATVVPVVITFFLVLFCVKESPVWKAKRQEQKAQPRASGNAIPLVALFNKKNLRNTLLGLGVSIFGMYGWWTLFTFLPTYIDKTLNVGITKGAEFMIWTSIGAFFGYLLFGAFADRVGRRPTFAVFFVAMGIMITVFIYTVTSTGLTYLPLVGIALGFFTGYYSGYGALFSELYSTDVRATGAGFLYNGGRAAVFVGPMIITYLIPKVGFSLAINSAALAFVVAAVFVLLMKETKGIEIATLDKNS